MAAACSSDEDRALLAEHSLVLPGTSGAKKPKLDTDRLVIKWSTISFNCHSFNAEWYQSNAAIKPKCKDTK